MSLKHSFSVLFLTICSVVFSQQKKVKIKVSKDKIVVNKVDVAKIVEVDEDKMLYAIEDLSGKKILDIKVNNSGAGIDLNRNNWMTVTSSEFKTVNIVDYNMVGMSTDPMNTIGLSLGRNFDLFTESGVNQSGLEDFFKVGKTSQNKEKRTGYGGPEIDSYGEGFDGKVKIKNDIVTLGKSEVAKLVEKDSLFTYTSFDGSKSLNVIFHDYIIYGEKENNRFRWLELSDNKGNSADVRMEFTLNFANNSKQITVLLAKAYNLITTDGLANLDSFFAINRPELSGDYNMAKAENDKMLAEMKATVDRRRPLYKLSETGEIKRASDDQYLGKIILPKNLDMIEESTTKIIVGERFNKKILELIPTGGRNEFVAIFYGNDYYYFRSDNTNIAFEKDQQEIREEILNLIIGKNKDSILDLGYEEYKAIKLSEAVKRYKARKLLSPNIYAKQGFVIDDEGEKFEGKISINFEELINPAKDESVVFKNVAEVGGNSKYGKEVYVAYVNEKGKDKAKTFKSSRGTQFYIDEGNSAGKYVGFKTNVDEFEAAIAAVSLNFNYSSYYYVLSESDKIIFYKKPLTDAKGIKTKVQDRGYNFITANADRNFERLKKYLEDCSSLPESFKDLDYTSIEDINTLIEYYNSSCK
ncbi:hypothetical protein [Maribacter sp. Asnod2-G09]|uniref:hypothetical protein n=1 Tax=Maribacter sp. Asnod2-G09 TaxID=3160577 RepID=UPI003869C79C